MTALLGDPSSLARTPAGLIVKRDTMAQSNLPAKNLDELINVTIAPGRTLDDAFTAYDDYDSEVKQNHLYNNILVPAQTRLYNIVTGKLADLVGASDDLILYGKKAEVQKALAIGIKEYFSLTQPSQIRGLAALHLSEEEEFEVLARLFDEHIGVGKFKGIQSIRTFEAMAKNKKVTIGHFKRALHGQTSQTFVQATLMTTKNEYVKQQFSAFSSMEMFAYLQPKLDAANVDYEDNKVAYALGPIEQLVYFRDESLKARK
ncbi:hypothetical protein HYT55_05755 [Candidatus Woesearchaeota archaeon]|nr:hypothetical protein [Candidatus Woesearchaeota archaeon]